MDVWIVFKDISWVPTWVVIGVYDSEEKANNATERQVKASVGRDELKVEKWATQ